jgi:type IV secretory pathway TraG/TraD family ATPase VirD4
MLGAEREVQTLLIAPPRSGKSSGYVIPWLLDHRGPALVSSTKRDVYDATVAYRRSLGRVWVYDPFGPKTCSFSPLTNSTTWEGALRTAGALASAAHSEPASSAAEFWDREASMVLAPLLHAAAVTNQSIDRVLYWLDTRDFDEAEQHLESAGMQAAAAQLRSVLMRDPRNRETTIMSASSLLHAYRYPRVAQATADDLTPAAFLDGNNTIYVVAAAHHQQDLQPVILALVCSIYEAAIEASRRNGPFDPPLYLLLDETANIAPIRDLAPWLSQCGDHGITIATSWQSIAQIDHRYGKDERDAILAASTAQLFLPPLADPTTTGYITSLLGEEPVTHASHNRGSPTHDTLTVSEHNVAAAPWLRQIQRGHGLLIYRDLPPAVARAPGWYEDPRFSEYARFVRTGTQPIDGGQTTS